MSQRSSLNHLQTLDTKLDNIRNRIQEIDEIINSDKDIQALKNSVSNSEDIVRKRSTKLKNVVAEVNTVQRKITANENKLYSGSIKNPKELQDLQTELQSLKKRLQAYEDEQLKLMISLEDAENEHAKLVLQLKTAIAKKESENANLSSEKENLQKQQNNLQIEKNTITPQIQPDLLAKYEKLRIKRKGLAVATLVDNACSACGNSLTSADIQIVKSSAAEYYCKMCGRFLYSG